MRRERFRLGSTKRAENLMNGAAGLRATDAAMQHAMVSLCFRTVWCRAGMRCLDWSRAMTFAAARDSGRARGTRSREILLLTIAAKAGCTADPDVYRGIRRRHALQLMVAGTTQCMDRRPV